jgi:two-component system cell cycle response regulator
VKRQVTFDGSTAALLATAGGILLIVLAFRQVDLRRSRHTPEDQVSAVADEVESRLGGRMNELLAMLAKAEQETRRARLIGDLGTSIELEDVLDRLLQAAREISGAAAAAVSVDQPSGKPALVRSLGVELPDPEALAIGATPDGRMARAISIRYRFAEGEGNGPLLRSAVTVPLVHESEIVGQLAVYSHDPGEGSDETVAQVEELAARAAPMVGNARRFREARLLADVDSLTGLHNHRYFHEALAREVRRAQRYGRSLSLVLLDADMFKAVNDRIGHLAGDAVLAEAAHRIGGVVRAVDIACRVGGDEFAVIVPESSLLDAEQLAARIQEAVSARPIGEAGAITFSAGVAELEEREDRPGFFERADRALYRAKELARDELGESRYGATSL